ncbi:MAG: ATP-binding protein [Acidobacteriia bacterium]|nr:ATP-binding protein [Terriglobia bacterium]
MVTSPSSQPSAACPVCDGTGWKQIAVPGKAPRMTRCDCRTKNRSERLLEIANIPPRYQDCTLADFDTDFPSAHRSLSAARLIAGRFVEEYHPAESAGLLFTGPIGIGKTHLAVGIILELIRSKHTHCLFCDYRDLLKKIIDSYNPTVETTELEVLRPIVETEILVLDELGAVKTTQWVWETVSYIINSRYNTKRTTIITTNFPNLPAGYLEGPQKGFSQSERAKAAARTETLGDRITERMRSRLNEMCLVVSLEGIDFRTGPKKRHG